MKALVIGNYDSLIFKRILDNIYHCFYDDVVVISTGNSSSDINSKYQIFHYKDRNIFFSFINLLKIRIYVASKYRCFDIINYHYIGFFDKLISALFNNIGNTIIYSFWGSDILRNNSIIDYLLGLLVFKKEYRYTFTSIKAKKGFINKYKKKSFPHMHLWYYGDEETLNEICLLRKKENKQKNRKVIVIGYNGSPFQRHCEVIDALANIKNKNRYYIIIPATYSLSDSSYVKTIEKKLIEFDFKYEIIKNFMSTNEMAALINKTDIFIHNQITDSMSNSVVEFLYAGVYVLNTIDTFYEEFNELNLNIHYFNSVDELPILIEKCVKTETGEMLRNIVSWESSKKQFMEIIKKHEYY